MGLLMGKFRQCLTELSARDAIMAGYYSLTFFFFFSFFFFFFSYFCPVPYLIREERAAALLVFHLWLVFSLSVMVRLLFVLVSLAGYMFSNCGSFYTPSIQFTGILEKRMHFA